MSKETIDKIKEKYEAGTSTLSEEKLLFTTSNETDPRIEAWSAFVSQKKKTAPLDLSTSIWNSIEKKKRKKHQLSIRVMLAAASVFLIAFLALNQFSNKEISHKEKEALLAEALDMFSDSEPKELAQNIIYEDDMVIIYTIQD
jgi:hypothetical protein